MSLRASTDDVVVARVSNATITVGDPLYVFGKGLTMMAELKSIQLNDVDVPTRRLLTRPRSVSG